MNVIADLEQGLAKPVGGAVDGNLASGGAVRSVDDEDLGSDAGLELHGRAFADDVALVEDGDPVGRGPEKWRGRCRIVHGKSPEKVSCR